MLLHEAGTWQPAFEVVRACRRQAFWHDAQLCIRVHQVAQSLRIQVLHTEVIMSISVHLVWCALAGVCKELRACPLWQNPRRAAA